METLLLPGTPHRDVQSISPKLSTDLRRGGGNWSLDQALNDRRDDDELRFPANGSLTHDPAGCRSSSHGGHQMIRRLEREGQ